VRDWELDDEPRRPQAGLGLLAAGVVGQRLRQRQKKSQNLISPWNSKPH
jgi:hypothetical protein